LEVRAFAKINLSLEVLGRRPDGYHEVRTVLQTIDLADRLEVQPAASLQVECDDPALAGEANLVWRAATALAAHSGIRPLARICIHKSIPVGVGLGGGSSDAAAALVALNRLWGLDLPAPELALVAAGLGADVPFLLQGGTALAQGRGDQVSPLPALPALPLLLVCPGRTIAGKTAQLYSRLTPAHYTDGTATDRLAQALERGEPLDEVNELLHNVFEAVAFQAFPDLARLWRRLQGLVSPGKTPHLSGAGPALFCLPATQEEYLRAARVLPPEGARAYLVQTVKASPVVC
jgi:4-diphosphocytidyl-2-C-methyl-D-erythritol kinase